MKTKKPKHGKLKERRAVYKTKPTSVEKFIRLSSVRAKLLSQLAKQRELSEDEIVEKALDIFFSLTDQLDQHTERRAWSVISEESLARAWNNDEDAAYDHWRDLYGIPAR